MFKYDVSIITAVYNNEKYLTSCIESVIKQTYDFEKIQLILINDGSTDKSLEICKEYERKYSNILVISQENQGASVARNTGMDAAEGKYIMILDSDDKISEFTVESLIKFFDEHYDEVDLVTYPMLQIEKDKTIFNFRVEEYKNGSGVYDLEENPYLVQAAVNIIIKNRFENNIKYNTDMIFSEDEALDTQIVMEKGKIGFCDKATYIYNKVNDSSVCRTKGNPLYCFESLINYYEKIFEKYKNEEGKISKYIQALALNTFKWRLRSDELFPYHYIGEKYNTAVDRIVNIVSQIDDEIISNMPKLNVYYKMYFLKLKKANFKIQFTEDKKYEILCGDILLFSGRNITLGINRLKIKNGSIYVLAHIRNLIFEIDGYYPEVYIRYTKKDEKQYDEKIENLFISNKSFHFSKIKTNNFYGFETNIKLDEINKVEFIIKVNGHEMNTKFVHSAYSPFDRKIDRKTIESKNKLITLKKDKNGANYFVIKNKTLKRLIKLRLNNIKTYSKIDSRIPIYRAFSKSKKVIWLYNDRTGVIDNAFYQFKHDIKKKDGIKRYYIYEGDASVYTDKLDKKLNKYLVKHSTFKHKILFLRANKILTAFSSLHEYCPFEETFDYYRDVIKYELIYLQHGILHADLLKMYAKECTEIDKIVVSSNFEKDNFINKYKYNENEILAFGMPRLQKNSNEDKCIESENKILVAPSWRKYLINEPVKGVRKAKEKEFKASKYYNEINSFLRSKELIELLKRNNLKMDFQLHPIFKVYANLFEFDEEYINIVSNTDVEKYKILITDFSSFQFDFVSLQRPIVYFVPDIDEFRAGLHTYRKLDLPHEKAFGKLTFNKEELMNNIERIIKNGYKDEDIYIEREKSFFVNLNNAQENLYNKLME